MKKVKVVLTAVAVLAIVGGALAFKARQTQAMYVHAITDPIADRCTLQSFGITTLPNAVFIGQARAFTTATQGVQCKLVDIYRGL